MSILKRDKSTIYGLPADLQQLSDDIAQRATDRQAADGDLATLNTTAKTDLVVAINEVLSAVNGSTSAALAIDQNLADLADIVAARTNISVYSRTEIDNAIDAAMLDVGTDYQVADIAARDALADLSTNDRVFVADVGDGTWATYKPTTIDVGGAVTGWTTLSTQYSLESVISAASVKTEYESNADTNGFDDASQTKVGHLSVTEATDLDDMALKAELGQDILAIDADSTQVPSAESVWPYVKEATRTGGTATLKETVTVNAGGSSPDLIVLTYAPKGGVAGVMNFATVRYTDVNGVAYDAPIQATATPNEFTVALGTSGNWDGNSVDVQYAHVPPTGPTVDEQGYADQGTLSEP